jgi:hypothetical protein
LNIIGVTLELLSFWVVTWHCFFVFTVFLPWDLCIWVKSLVKFNHL